MSVAAHPSAPGMPISVTRRSGGTRCNMASFHASIVSGVGIGSGPPGENGPTGGGVDVDALLAPAAPVAVFAGVTAAPVSGRVTVVESVGRTDEPCVPVPGEKANHPPAPRATT